MFRYRPVDRKISEFRLIELLPSGNPDGPLQAKLFHASLDSVVVFETISYVWGEPPLIHVLIRLSYLSKSSALLVSERTRYPFTNFRTTVALAEALRKFRCSNVARKLWVDSTCINQADDEEKIWQIAAMARIYQKGSQSLLWLGPETHDCQRALDYLGTFENVSEIVRVRVLRERMRARAWLYRGGGTPILVDNHELEESFDALLVKNKFWSRVWIIQEVLSAFVSEQ